MRNLQRIDGPQTRIVSNYHLVMLSRRSFMLAAVGTIAAVRARAQGIPRVTLDEFIDVSERLLRRSKLDRETAQLFLAALNADADTAVTLAYVVQSNGNPTPEQAALRATIIEWWQTGVYEINGERRLAARSRAVWSPYPKPVESNP
jgi:hypothetical protein